MVFTHPLFALYWFGFLPVPGVGGTEKSQSVDTADGRVDGRWKHSALAAIRCFSVMDFHIFSVFLYPTYCGCNVKSPLLTSLDLLSNKKLTQLVNEFWETLGVPVNVLFQYMINGLTVVICPCVICIAALERSKCTLLSKYVLNSVGALESACKRKCCRLASKLMASVQSISDK